MDIYAEISEVEAVEEAIKFVSNNCEIPKGLKSKLPAGLYKDLNKAMETLNDTTPS